MTRKKKRIEKHVAMLDTPVTDFDLTVRARNCLRKMNIRTLGDLAACDRGGATQLQEFWRVEP